MPAPGLPTKKTRVKELVKLAGRLVYALVLGLVLGFVGLYQVIVAGHKSAWFWFFIGTVCIAVVFIYMAWKALGERDRARTEAPSGGVNIAFHGSTVSDVGQLYGEGPPGGTIPVTPKMLELERRRQLLRFLVKEYAASHKEDETGLLAGQVALPQEWAEARLDEQGETWRLETYTLSVDPNDLLGDQP